MPYVQILPSTSLISNNMNIKNWSRLDKDMEAWPSCSDFFVGACDIALKCDPSFLDAHGGVSHLRVVWKNSLGVLSSQKKLSIEPHMS